MKKHGKKIKKIKVKVLFLTNQTSKLHKLKVKDVMPRMPHKKRIEKIDFYHIVNRGVARYKV